MLTVHEAYLIAKAKAPEEYQVLQFCSEFGDFWLFHFGPAPYDKNDYNTWVVGGADGVNKKTGEWFSVGSLALGTDARFHKDKAVKVPVERVIAERKPLPRAAVTRTQRGVTKRAVAAMA